MTDEICKKGHNPLQRERPHNDLTIMAILGCICPCNWPWYVE
jgi:hypothetical protein